MAGTETVTLDEACSLCKQYNINLYAYCPTTEMNMYASDKEIEEYKNAIEKKAGGKFYLGDIDKNMSNIVNEIKNTKKTLLKTSKKTYVTDHPEIFFVSIIIIFLILIVLEKRIRI